MCKASEGNRCLHPGRNVNNRIRRYCICPGGFSIFRGIDIPVFADYIHSPFVVSNDLVIGVVPQGGGYLGRVISDRAGLIFCKINDSVRRNAHSYLTGCNSISAF